MELCRWDWRASWVLGLSKRPSCRVCYSWFVIPSEGIVVGLQEWWRGLLSFYSDPPHSASYESDSLCSTQQGKTQEDAWRPLLSPAEDLQRDAASPLLHLVLSYFYSMSSKGQKERASVHKLPKWPEGRDDVFVKFCWGSHHTVVYSYSCPEPGGSPCLPSVTDIHQRVQEGHVMAEWWTKAKCLQVTMQ